MSTFYYLLYGISVISSFKCHGKSGYLKKPFIQFADCIKMPSLRFPLNYAIKHIS